MKKKKKKKEKNRTWATSGYFSFYMSTKFDCTLWFEFVGRLG